MHILPCRQALRAVLAILAISFGSCKAGAPTAPEGSKISFSTTTLAFSGNQSERQVTIHNLGVTEVDWRLQGSSASWLTTTPNLGSIPAGASESFTVRVDRYALGTGSHSATITVQAPGFSQMLSVSVQHEPARLEIEPSALDFNLLDTAHTVQIVNEGGSSLEWSLAAPPWLNLNPSSGLLAPGNGRDVSVAVNRGMLSNGRHTAVLSLASNGGNDSIPVSVEVGPTARIRLSPESLDFGSSATARQFWVMNDGNATLNWSAHPAAPWISVSPENGAVPPGLGALVSISINRGNLTHGINQASVQLSSNGGAAVFAISAEVTPARLPDAGLQPPQLRISPLSLDFGNTTTELHLTIHNSGDQPLQWSGAAQSEWVFLSVSAGQVSPHSQSAPVSVRILRNKIPSTGTNFSSIQIASNGGSATALVSANGVAQNPPTSPPPPSNPPTNPPPTNPPPTNPPPTNPPPTNPPVSEPAKLEITPLTLDFGETGKELTVRITNRGEQQLDWSAQTADPWLALQITSGHLSAGASQSVTVSATRSVLNAAGEYQSLISFSSNAGSASVTIRLKVPAPIPPPPPSSGSDDGSVYVTDFGARGDDQLVDNAAFEAAIAALPLEGGTVHVPAGTFLFNSVPRSSVGRGIDFYRRSNITLSGSGIDQTMLRMAPNRSYNGDAHMILLELSTGITIQDLTIDGNRANVTYIDEQAHGVEVRGSSNVLLRRILFTGMHGDGIRLLGLIEPSLAWVDQVKIEDCRFAANGRSGVAVQRRVRGVTIDRNTFTQISDQSIDMEPTGTGLDIAPRDFEITNNHFFNTAALGVTITGLSSEDPARNMTFSNNKLEGTGIFIFDAVDVRVENNEIVSGASWHAIEIRKGSERIWIVGNRIDGTSSQKPAITLMYHTSRAPKNVHVIDNTIQNLGSGGFYSRDSEGLEVRGNTFKGDGGVAVHVADVVSGSPLTGFRIEDNTFDAFEVGIVATSRGDTISGLCIRTNSFFGVLRQTRTEGPVVLSCT